MATSAFGTLFKKSSTTIAEVIDVNGPGLTRELIDATHLGSTQQFAEKLSGKRDAGDVSIRCNFLPGGATYESLEDDYLSNTAGSYSVTWTDSGPTVWSFTAFVTGIAPVANTGEKLVVDITFGITGVPTLDA